MLRSGSGKKDDDVTVTIERKEEKGNANWWKFDDFRKEGKYFDVTIVFDDERRIPCHRIVLAGCSAYFDSLFSIDMSESNQREMRLKEVSSQTFEVALEFIYAGKCQFSFDDFFELLLLADMFLLNDLRDSLISYLKNLHDPDKASLEDLDERRLQRPL